jgi:undecaprenyl-diphosphatase
MTAGRLRVAAFLAACVLTALSWPADPFVSNWFEEHRIAGLNSTVLATTSAWTLTTFVAAMCGWLLWRRRGRDAALVLVTTLATLGIGSLLKVSIGRKRPYETLEDFVSLTTADDASFPSNHTSGAFAACLVLSALVPRLRPLFVLVALVIATTRLYVGVHFLSDVCGGLALALAVSGTALHLTRHWRAPSPEPEPGPAAPA